MKTCSQSLLCGTILAFAFGVPSAAAQAPSHPFFGAITGERIAENDQFKGACGVAVGDSSNVYVADYYNNRVAVFNAKAEFLTQITNVAPLDANGKPLNGPCDLAVDSAGRLYVNEYHREVVRFTPSQFPPTKMTSYGAAVTIDSSKAAGVAVDPPTGDVYVNDRTYIARYEVPVEPGEASVEKIGLGSLVDAYGVAISRFPATEGLVYVADAANETIKVYDPDADPSSPARVIEGAGTHQGRFYLTDADLAVDPADGHLYVADNLEPHFEERPEAVVDEFSVNGYYRGPVPRSYWNGQPSFLVAGEPTGLAVGKGSQLYVTSGNYEDAAVYIFGPPAPTPTQVLTVAKSGGGAGTVTSLPAAIGCGTVCAGEFDRGSTVLLVPDPAPGSSFAGWSGCDEVLSSGRCAVDMGVDRSVTATFEALPGAAQGSRSGGANEVYPSSHTQLVPATFAPILEEQRVKRRSRPSRERRLAERRRFQRKASHRRTGGGGAIGKYR